MSAEIAQQVEFYFSDENLLTDKFMNENLNKNGGLALSTLMTFKRMSKYSLEEVEKAIQEDSKSLSVEEGLIKRNTPLPSNEERKKIRNELNGRTAVLKNIPTDWNLDFLQKQLGPFQVAQIRIRNNGLVFVSFVSSEACDKFLSEKTEIDGKTIEKQTHADYAKVLAEKGNGQKSARGGKGGRGGRGGKFGRGGQRGGRGSRQERDDANSTPLGSTRKFGAQNEEKAVDAPKTSSTENTEGSKEDTTV